MPKDPRIAATRRYLESQRDKRNKSFSWMSNKALGRAGGMSASRRDKLMGDLLSEKTDIEKSYRSQLGLQEATWQREEDLKTKQKEAATIKMIGTILGGVAGVAAAPFTGGLSLAAVTAGMGIGAAAGGLAGSVATGEPDTAAMAPNELIAAIQGLSSTDYIDQAMEAIGGAGKERDVYGALIRRLLRGEFRRGRKTSGVNTSPPGDSTMPGK